MSAIATLTAVELRLTAAEWKAIKLAVPPALRDDDRHVSDRLTIAALLAVEASGLSVEFCARSIGLAPATVRSRKMRWQQSGVLADIITAGKPAVARIRDAYHRTFGEQAMECSRAMEVLSRSWPMPLGGAR
jgi:hypothetical protein